MKDLKKKAEKRKKNLMRRHLFITKPNRIHTKKFLVDSTQYMYSTKHMYDTVK